MVFSSWLMLDSCFSNVLAWPAVSLPSSTLCEMRRCWFCLCWLMLSGALAGLVVDGGAAVPVDGGLLGAVVCGGAALPLGAGALVVCATTGNIKASKDALSKVTFRG